MKFYDRKGNLHKNRIKALFASVVSFFAKDVTVADFDHDFDDEFDEEDFDDDDKPEPSEVPYDETVLSTPSVQEALEQHEENFTNLHDVLHKDDVEEVNVTEPAPDEAEPVDENTYTCMCGHVTRSASDPMICCDVCGTEASIIVKDIDGEKA